MIIEDFEKYLEDIDDDDCKELMRAQIERLLRGAKNEPVRLEPLVGGTNNDY